MLSGRERFRKIEHQLIKKKKESCVCMCVCKILGKMMQKLGNGGCLWKGHLGEGRSRMRMSFQYIFGTF